MVPEFRASLVNIKINLANMGGPSSFIIYPQADGKGLTRACKILPYEKNMRT